MFLLFASSFSKPSIVEALESGEHCTICQDFYTRLHSVDFIKAKNFQDELYKSCSSKPLTSKRLCQVIASDWFHDILSAKNMESGCRFACNSSLKEHHHARPRVLRPIPQSDIPCGTCLMVAQYGMHLYLEEAMAETINPFYEACIRVEMFQDRCHLFTDEKYHKIAEHVVNGMHEDDLCNAYGLC